MHRNWKWVFESPHGRQFYGRLSRQGRPGLAKPLVVSCHGNRVLSLPPIRGCNLNGRGAGFQPEHRGSIPRTRSNLLRSSSGQESRLSSGKGGFDSPTQRQSGLSQVERRGPLTPACAGSIPAAPAKTDPVMTDLVERLRKRAEIRRQIATRKSVQEGKPDRIADLLDEAAGEIERLSASIAKR